MAVSGAECAAVRAEAPVIRPKKATGIARELEKLGVARDRGGSGDAFLRDLARRGRGAPILLKRRVFLNKLEHGLAKHAY